MVHIYDMQMLLMNYTQTFQFHSDILRIDRGIPVEKEPHVACKVLALYKNIKFKPENGLL